MCFKDPKGSTVGAHCLVVVVDKLIEPWANDSAKNTEWH